MKLVSENGKPEQHMVTASAKLFATGEMKVFLVMDPGQQNQAIIGEASFRADSPEAMSLLLQQSANLVPRMLKMAQGPQIVQAPAAMADKLKQGPQ